METLTESDFIQIGILLVGLSSVIILFFTLHEGQKQSGRSLAISEYNILQQDLEFLISEFNALKFKVNETYYSKAFIDAGKNADGIMILDMFFTIQSEMETSSFRRELVEKQIIDFRHNVIFPLVRHYDKLLDFLREVKSDKILPDNYKGKFYKKVESKILQNYFRICNNAFGEAKTYNIEAFNSLAYSQDRFYEINNFYIYSNAFRFNDLKFYIDTV